MNYAGLDSVCTRGYTITRQVDGPPSRSKSTYAIHTVAAKAIEYMIIDALLSANRHMKFAGQVKKPKEFLHLTDDIMTRIEMTTDPVSSVLTSSNNPHSSGTRNLRRLDKSSRGSASDNFTKTWTRTYLSGIKRSAVTLALHPSLSSRKQEDHARGLCTKSLRGSSQRTISSSTYPRCTTG